MKRWMTCLMAILLAGVACGKPLHYSEWMVESEMARVPHPYNLDFSPTKARWSYTVGIELDAMLDVYLRYGNEAVREYIDEYPAKMVDAKGNITGYKYADFNLDNVRPGHFLLRYHRLLNPSTKDSLALETLMRQLDNQQRTADGVWWHKAIYAHQVWLDGIFMGLPFYTAAAPWIRADRLQSYYDDAVRQILTTDQRTYDAQTQLWKHAWDETHSMFWADPNTGQSRHTWARALGWFAMAIVEVLDVLPDDHEGRPQVVQLLQRVMASVVDYQDADTGVWYDVMDVDDPRNYLEATASSMFTYCLLKGWRMGYLDSQCLDAGIKAYKGIAEQFLKENADGSLSLTRCCSVSGLGPASNPARDGSFEYYMSEPIRDNDAKGVGPFVWASLEMENMGYNTENLGTHMPDGVKTTRTARADGEAYDLSGRKTSTAGWGVYVVDGKKWLRRR